MWTRTGGLAVALGLLCLTGARAAAQVESRATLEDGYAVVFAFGAGTPDLPHVGSIDLEVHNANRSRFVSLGVASPGGHALLGAWLNWKSRLNEIDQKARGFIGAGPTVEMGNVGVRLAGGARTGAELRISPGLRLRIEVRGLLFAAGDGAGEGLVLGLVGFRAGGTN